jgi:hypothetical protein
MNNKISNLRKSIKLNELWRHKESIKIGIVSVIISTITSVFFYIFLSEKFEKNIREANLQASKETLKIVNEKIAVLAQEEVEKARKKLDELNLERARVDEELNKTRKIQIEKLGVTLENITLDKLESEYSELVQKRKSLQFQTYKGNINFSSDNLAMIYVPSVKKLASIKIGKKEVTENEQLIKAWIEESEKVKVLMGYERKYKTTNRSTYGEYIEGLYTKGDSYIKTYFQYERVQGTYARHSLQYTYFVEIGSEKRMKQAQSEQYNKKLGS